MKNAVIYEEVYPENFYYNCPKCGNPVEIDDRITSSTSIECPWNECDQTHHFTVQITIETTLEPADEYHPVLDKAHRFNK